MFAGAVLRPADQRLISKPSIYQLLEMRNFNGNLLMNSL